MAIKFNKYSLLVLIGLAFLFNVPYQFTILFPTKIYYIVELFFIFIYGLLTINILSFKPRKINFLFIFGILLILYSSLLANINFKQPIYLGLFSERGRFLVIFFIFIFMVLYKNKIPFKKLIELNKNLGWICLISYSTLYFLSIGGGDFINSETFINHPENKGTIAVFDGMIIIFMIIYYFNKAIIYSKHREFSFFKMFLFLCYLFFIYKKRGMVLFLVTTFLFFFLKELTLKKKLIILFIFFGLFSLLFFLFKEKLIEAFSLYYSFTDVINSKDNYDNEVSVGVRLFVELPIAIKWINESWQHLLFGSGNLSHFYKKGFEGHFGYFYPGDLGLLGMIFKYGLLSQLLLKSLYVSLHKNYKLSLVKNISKNYSLTIRTYYYFTVFLFLYSLQTGYDMKYIEITFFLWSIFYLQKNRSKLKT
jgi:hypothetical protein